MNTAGGAHAMFASQSARRLASRPMIYNNAHHETVAWPELEAWLEYLEVANYAKGSILIYERVCAKLLLLNPDTPFDQFTDTDLLKLLAGWSKKSRHVYKAPLNGWFKWGYRSRRIPSNPADLLPDVRYRPTRNVQVFEPAEVAALCALPHPHGRLMTVLFETGIRRSEARLLTVRRIDFRAQEMLVSEGAKGSKDRQMPLTTAAAKAFDELIALDGLDSHDHFWSSNPGGAKVPRRLTPIAQATFQRWWELCIAEAGVKYRKPHTTRHTFATYWMDDRIDDGEVQLMLGHESIRTTRDIYDHRKVSKIGAKMRVIQSDEAALAAAGDAAN